MGNSPTTGQEFYSGDFQDIKDVCRVLGVTVLEAPGWEADDIIGTLALKAREQGLTTIIAANDKDMRYHLRLAINLLRSGI